MQKINRVQLQPLGQAIRQARKKRGFTLEELANRSSLSAALISRVENFRVLPSLLVLARLAAALDISLSQLVKGITVRRGPTYLIVRQSEQSEIEREESVGIAYKSIFETSVQAQHLQVGLLIVEPGAKRTPVTTSGDQFIYMLSGSIRFHLGVEIIDLEAGDTLFFDGRTEHVPENRSEVPASYLSVYLLHQKMQGEGELSE